MTRTLVAGIGNIFLSDDGFGVEVARRLATAPLPAGVTVTDYGIRGMHLAYDLASGFDAAILVDATSRGGAPGTIYVIEPDLPSGPAEPPPARTRTRCSTRTAWSPMLSSACLTCWAATGPAGSSWSAASRPASVREWD